MSFYRNLSNTGRKLLGNARAFKWLFNLSPMYGRSTARITYVSNDLKEVRIKVRISYKNRNYMGTIFGGSMFAAVDPIPMIQLVTILGENYVVWDKSATINFKRPAKESLFATFQFTASELHEIKTTVANSNETEIVKQTQLTNKEGNVVFCEVNKTIYIADKTYFKQKRKC